jgi:uncharacterized protein involved in exopolysaccharide biosynthesis
MSPNEVLLLIRKRFWWIVAGAVIAGVVALVFSLVWPPSYRAEALLLITKLRPEVTLDPRFQTVAEENVVNLSIQDDQVRRQTLVGLTQSPDLMSQLLDQLGQTLAPDERSLSFLNAATDVSTQGNLIVLEAEASSPAQAAAVANTWARVFRDQVNLLYSTTSPGYDQIQEEVTGALALYEDASQAVEQFERTSSERELGRQINQKLQILEDLEAAHLAAARRRVGSLLTRISEIDQLSFGAQSLRNQLGTSTGSAALSPGEQFALFSLEASTFSQSVPFSITLELGAGWLEDSQITAGQALERLNALQETLGMLREMLQVDVSEQSQDLLKGMELLAYGSDDAGTGDIARLQSEISELRADLQEEQRTRQGLVDEQDLAKENYLTLTRKAAEIQILSKLTGVEVQIAAAAQEPEIPSFPKPLVTTALAVVAGGLAGLVLAFLKEIETGSEDR